MDRVRVVPGAWQTVATFGVLSVLPWVGAPGQQAVWFAIEATALIGATLLMHEAAHGVSHTV